ncbi:MAG: hypothetical protein IPL06_22560 [Betaproteobacteria bacterium]|nr:hypothetical protein [Betaproteobacteria bacterium]
MNTSYLRLNKTVGENASDPRAWLAFALEASGASRWEIALPGDSFSLTELWQRMTGDDAATAIPRADLLRLREPLSALLEAGQAEFSFEFNHVGRDGLPARRRTVIRLVGADPSTGRPRRLRGLNFRMAPAAEAPRQPPGEPEAQAMRDFETYCLGIAQEMRAPAQAVTRLADTLFDRHGSAIGEDARILAARIAVAGRDLEAMLEGLTALTRLAGQELVLARVNLAEVAREAWNHLAPGDPAHAGRLEIACEGAPIVRADRALAWILLRHLLANALKFSRGAPRSPVTFAWVEGPPPHFVVRDRGVGFDFAAARNLFEPFGRQHPAAQFEGAGIGLAIVRRAAERHGGRTWAESRPGEGAAFHFTLPAA